ncbi:DNA repair protein RecO [Formosa sp. S-31]|uniref:DNA repair protein RecO n=1 Tax=Formosa sp. S-31 TaxID=2790949 RepID=UPI003EB6ED0D
MFYTTNAIVLSKLKYRDNDLIVSCYTEDFGVLSFLLRGVLKSKKGSAKTAYFQWLSQIQIVIDYKPNRTLHTIKDVKINEFYISLHTQVVKSTISMFLAEVLVMSLKEEEANQELFQFLTEGLNWVDKNENVANFHLYFLFQLTRYLGFFPDFTHSNQYKYFNLTSGSFEPQSTSVYSVSGEEFVVLKSLFGIKFDDLATIKISSMQRKNFLEMLMLYYELHLGHFKKPKSLDIFSQIFN